MTARAQVYTINTLTYRHFNNKKLSWCWQRAQRV